MASAMKVEGSDLLWRLRRDYGGSSDGEQVRLQLGDGRPALCVGVSRSMTLGVLDVAMAVVTSGATLLDTSVNVLEVSSDDLAESRGLTLEVVPGSYFLMGVFRQDLIVGDAAFDDRFIVRCSSEESTASWLDDEARAALLAAYDPNSVRACAIKIDNGVIAATAVIRDDGEEYAHRILSAVESLVQLPRRRAARWRQALAPLDATWSSDRWRLDGEFFARLQSPVGEITITPRWHESSHAKVEHLRTEVILHAPAGRSKGELEELLSDASIEPLAVAADQEVVVILEGEVLDCDTIAAVVRVLEQVAQPLPSSGPYR